ncbi:MAG: hypothetical protein Greene041662_1066 [Candidatus Peregrinibacteria bacterium Greene0416_62]|nr:MAG: hypothetical protein Greene041662_1066 [Candidatus Peregrinibacteria bacterium Greene0416_62]
MTAMVTVFSVFGADKFLRPEVWMGWMPSWMENALGISREAWLSSAGGIELLLAAALLFPQRMIRQIAAWGMAAYLILILTQAGMNDLFVRDLGLFLSAVAMAILL